MVLSVVLVEDDELLEDEVTETVGADGGLVELDAVGTGDVVLTTETVLVAVGV